MPYCQQHIIPFIHKLHHQTIDFGGCVGKLHVMSCYATTRATSKQDKDNFSAARYISLAAGNQFIILGDFNTCGFYIGRLMISSRIYVLVPHDFGLVNDASRELLSFSLCHEVTDLVHAV